MKETMADKNTYVLHVIFLYG